MSVSYSANLVVGLRWSDLCEVKYTAKTETRYDVMTGAPHPVTIQVGRLHVLGTPTDFPVEGTDWVETKLKLDFFADQSYPSRARGYEPTGVVGISVAVVGRRDMTTKIPLGGIAAARARMLEVLAPYDSGGLAAALLGEFLVLSAY